MTIVHVRQIGIPELVGEGRSLNVLGSVINEKGGNHCKTKK